MGPPPHTNKQIHSVPRIIMELRAERSRKVNVLYSPGYVSMMCLASNTRK